MPTYDRVVEIRSSALPFVCAGACWPDRWPAAARGTVSYVKVNGKVSYTDGTPIKATEIKLIFIPETLPTVDEQTHARAATAYLKPDGTFDAVTSHTLDDGLLPGKHKVLIFITDGRNQRIDGLVPAEYRDPAKTPIEVDTANLPMEIKVKKP